MSEFIKDYLVLKHRPDGQGSHYLYNLPQFLIAKHFNIDLFHQKNYMIPCSRKKLEEYLFFIPIMKHVKYINSDNKKKEKRKPIPGGLRGASAHFVELVEQDVISYFRNNHKDNFYNVIKQEAEKRNYALPWIDNSKIICINIRLEDSISKRFCNRTNAPDYNGTKSFDYVKTLIEDKSFHKFERKYSHLDVQAPIDIIKLTSFIHKFKAEFPEKEIHIITYCKRVRNFPIRIKNIADENNIKIHHKNNEDYDLWLMMNCDILVLAKSTYSIMAGLNHRGSTVYCPKWGTSAALGFGSKFDKSGWISYV